MDKICIQKGSGPDYDFARQLQNARFNLYPIEICYCANEPEVQKHLEDAKPGFVRIRSGGHHHEGMCSGTDVRIIDVSKIQHIQIKDDVLTVGPGAKLGKIYNELWKTRRLLPGGGCPDVCVGGLAQGGGWGLYSRYLGLTCDRLIGFRMVRANGKIVDATKGDPAYEKLFKAVCGGGGGNFGVITEFRFQLARLESEIWSFTVEWADPNSSEVYRNWRVNFPNNADRKLTSFLRYTVAGGAVDDKPIVLAGNYVGSQAEMEKALIRQLPDAWSTKSNYKPERVDVVKDGQQVYQHPEYQPGPPLEALRALPHLAGVSDEKLRDLSSTCAGIPYPHKISSCYPNLAFIRGGISTMHTYLSDSARKPESSARRYVSLHGMGGAIKDANDWSSYAFRHYDYLLQYQAWWANKDQKDVETRCIEWVEGFRKALKAWTEYSFINFPDHKVPIEDYYGDSFAELIEVKKEYDEHGLFDFPMGIPRS